jgi:hypothetical protein
MNLKFSILETRSFLKLAVLHEVNDVIKLSQFQVMLALLLAAACMIPDLTKEQGCENLHKLFDIHQQFLNGPPPM